MPLAECLCCMQFANDCHYTNSAPHARGIAKTARCNCISSLATGSTRIGALAARARVLRLFSEVFLVMMTIDDRQRPTSTSSSSVVGTRTAHYLHVMRMSDRAASQAAAFQQQQQLSNDVQQSDRVRWCVCALKDYLFIAKFIFYLRSFLVILFRTPGLGGHVD